MVYNSKPYKKNRDGGMNGIALLGEGSGMPVDGDDRGFISYLSDS